MKHLSVLIKPASAACNLRCKYCFYANVSSLREVCSFGNMKADVMENMIDQLYQDLEAGDHMTFAFQGGEPTLAGLTYFKNFINYVKAQNSHVKVHYALQTNGTLIDEQWCQFLKENQFLVGLSVDGNIKFHNDNRPDARGKGSYRKVMATKRLFDQYQIDYNVLCVLTNQNARHPQKIFKFLLSENLHYIQFIPCLDDLDTKESAFYALQPQRFASFYKQFFELWKKEFGLGNYISVNLFDNLVNLLARGRVGSCGLLGRCQPQYVIESNGNVYPCDFYVLDEYCLGNITEKSLTELFQNATMKKFLNCGRDEISPYCQKCSFFNMCGGGCKRMKNAMYLNKAETYCGYQDFLNTHYYSLKEISRFYRGENL